MAAYNVWRGTGNEPPVLREGVHATKAFRFSPPSGRSYIFSIARPEALSIRLYDATTLRKIDMCITIRTTYRVR